MGLVEQFGKVGGVLVLEGTINRNNTIYSGQSVKVERYQSRFIRIN